METYLAKVDADLERRPRNPHGFLQTYGPGSIGGGTCATCTLPEPCPLSAQGGTGASSCAFDVYDNSLAVIYFIMRGHLDKAKPIVDSFVSLLFPAASAEVDADTMFMTSSGRRVTPLAASYTAIQERATAGTYYGEAVSDGGADTGNNAWVGIALARYAAASGQLCYADAARDLMEALASGSACHDQLGGFMGRTYGLRMYRMYFRSVEHNVDMYSFARMLGNQSVQHSAKTFVRSCYGADQSRPTVYATGTGGSFSCDMSYPALPIAADTQFWNELADVDNDKERKVAAISAALRPAVSTAGPPWVPRPPRDGGLFEEDIDHVGNANGEGIGHHYFGVRFTTWGWGIHWENTASTVMALAHFEAAYGKDAVPEASAFISKARDSIKRLLTIYGTVPGSLLGGNQDAASHGNTDSEYPGGSNNGFGNVYMRYPHLASVAWSGMMLMYQFDSTNPVREAFNPYHPPTLAMPRPSDTVIGNV